jgi:hypothetical protein
MPNTPVSIQEGCVVWFPTNEVEEPQLKAIAGVSKAQYTMKHKDTVLPFQELVIGAKWILIVRRKIIALKTFASVALTSAYHGRLSQAASKGAKKHEKDNTTLVPIETCTLCVLFWRQTWHVITEKCLKYFSVCCFLPDCSSFFLA